MPPEADSGLEISIARCEMKAITVEQGCTGDWLVKVNGRLVTNHCSDLDKAIRHAENLRQIDDVPVYGFQIRPWYNQSHRGRTGSHDGSV